MASGSPSLGGSVPESRTAPLHVLSRAVGGLFLLGGSGPSDADVLYFHPIAGRWEKTAYLLPTHEVPVAATFAFVDHRLWVVLKSGSNGKLVRVDATLGVGETIADFPLGEADVPHLAIDRDGSVVLARGGPTMTEMARFVVDKAVLAVRSTSLGAVGMQALALAGKRRSLGRSLPKEK